VRVAISATRDAEEPGVGSKPVALHLVTCAECRRFEAETKVLAKVASLQASRAVPDALKDLLANELARTVGSLVPPRRQRTWQLQPVTGLRRGARWFGALAPAAVVVIAIPLGALNGPIGHPTDPKTPCTVHLTSARVAGHS
jgi:hypothetical protein